MKIDDVLEILTSQQHDIELRKLNQNEYVLVYQYSPNSLHTVSVQYYNASIKMVECINSHGHNNQFPSIQLQDIVKLYRVTCSAVDATTVPGIEPYKILIINSQTLTFFDNGRLTLKSLKTALGSLTARLL